jgi:hypothetical protein
LIHLLNLKIISAILIIHNNNLYNVVTNLLKYWG